MADRKSKIQIRHDLDWDKNTPEKRRFIQIREDLKRGTADSPGVDQDVAWQLAYERILSERAGISPGTFSEDGAPSSAEGGRTSENVSVSLSDFEGKPPVTEIEVLRWVFDNMEIEPLDLGTCPSAGAYGLLKRCQSDSVLRRYFYQSMWPRLLPSKALSEGAERSDEEDQNILDTIQRLKDAANDAISATL